MQDSDFILLRAMAESRQPQTAIGPLIPWACVFQDLDGEWIPVILYGTDPEQVYNDWRTQFPRFQIAGIVSKTWTIGGDDEAP